MLLLSHFHFRCFLHKRAVQILKYSKLHHIDAHEARQINCKLQLGSIFYVIYFYVLSGVSYVIHIHNSLLRCYVKCEMFKCFLHKELN